MIQAIEVPSSGTPLRRKNFHLNKFKSKEVRRVDMVAISLLLKLACYHILDNKNKSNQRSTETARYGIRVLKIYKRLKVGAKILRKQH